MNLVPTRIVAFSQALCEALCEADCANPEVAVLVLQQIHFAYLGAEKALAKSEKLPEYAERRDGLIYVRKSASEICAEWGNIKRERTIQSRLIPWLRDNDILFIERFGGGDPTNYYAINYNHPVIDPYNQASKIGVAVERKAERLLNKEDTKKVRGVLCAVCSTGLPVDDAVRRETDAGYEYHVCAMCDIRELYPPSGVSGQPHGNRAERIVKAVGASQQNFSSLTDDVRLHAGIELSDTYKDHRNFLKFLREKKEIGQTIEAFMQWWYQSDWRGLQGDKPSSLKSVIESWPKAFSQPKTEPVERDGQGFVF